MDDMFRRQKSPYDNAWVGLAIFVIAVVWEVIWYAPPWWAR